MKNNGTNGSQLSFGAGLLTAISRSGAQRPITAAIFPCSYGDGSYMVVNKLINSAIAARKKTALLDFSLVHETDESSAQEYSMDITGAMDEKTEAPIPCPSSGILRAGAFEDPDRITVDLDLEKLARLIKRFEKNFDIIVANGPALLGNNLAEMIAPSFDQNYLVVRQEYTTQFQLHYAIQRLRRMGLEPAGLIMNDRRLPIPQWFYRIIFSHAFMNHSTNGYHR